MHGTYATSSAPYPGLRSFRTDESDIFFGRDEHVDQLIAKLARSHFLCVTGPSGCGKSSLVRTGLMNGLEAGFLPGRGSDWIFCDFNPGSRPLDALMQKLAAAVARMLPATDSPASRETEVFQIVSHYFRELRESSDINKALQSFDLGGRPILIFADQFEELFRYAQAEPNAAVKFVEILLQTAAAGADVYVVITIRTDELERCARYSGLTRAINESQFLTPTLDRYQIQEAIEGPIALFGGRIDPKLTVWLLNSLDEELDKLPLMQHALKLLYSRKTALEKRQDVVLGLEDYAAVFGLAPSAEFSASESRFALRNSLSFCLDQIHDALPARLKPATARTFCALTAVETGSRDIRRPLELARLGRIIGESEADTRTLITSFSSANEAYLCIRDGEGEIIDVPHECILRLWPRLQKRWLPNEKRSADNITLLARMAKDWDESKPRSGLSRLFGSPDVLKGYTLDRYRKWFETARPNKHWAERYLKSFRWPLESGEPGALMPPGEIYGKITSLLDASLRQRKIARITRVAVNLVALGMVGLFGLALMERSTTSRVLETSKVYNKLLESNLGTNTVSKLAKAADALESARSLGDEALIDKSFGNLWQALAATAELSRVNERVASGASASETEAKDEAEATRWQVFSASITPDAKYMLTVSNGGMVRRWPIADYQPGAFVLADDGKPPPAGARSLAIAPQGDTAVVGYADGSVRVMGINGPTITSRELLMNGQKPHTSFVLDVAFSGDGTMFVSSSHDGTIVGWTRQPGGSEWMAQPLADTRYIDDGGDRPLPGIPSAPPPQPIRIWSVDLEKNKTAVAYGLGDGRVCLLKLASGARAQCSAAGHARRASIKAIRFQPGRPILVSAGDDDKIALWDLSSDMRLVPPTRWLFEESDIWDLNFSGDGQMLASASWDGGVRVYDTANWRPITELNAHELSLRTVRFDATARLLVTSSVDHTARIFTPFATRISLLELSHQLRPVRAIGSAALGADGQWVAFRDDKIVYVKEFGNNEALPLPIPTSAMEVLNAAAATDPDISQLSDLASHPSLPILATSTRQPLILTWARQADGQWTADTVKLPGGAMDRTRPIAIGADGKTLAVAILENEKSAIMLCPAKEPGGWSCEESAANRIRRIPVDTAPNRCGRYPRAIALSPAGNMLATTGLDCTVSLFDLTFDPPKQTVLKNHVGIITSLQFSPDGLSLVSSSLDWTIRIWNVADGSSKVMNKHRGKVFAAGFSPSGRWLVSASADESIMITDPKNGNMVARLAADTKNIVTLDIKKTPRGALCAVASDGGTVNVFPVFENADELVGSATTFLEKNVHWVGDQQDALANTP